MSKNLNLDIEFKTTNLDIIAKLLLNKYILSINKYKFRIIDIEFLLNDVIEKEFGTLSLVHDITGSINRGENRGLLITIGDQDDYVYCKINSIMNMSIKNVIVGSNKVLNKIMHITGYNNLLEFNENIIKTKKIYENIKLEPITGNEIIYQDKDLQYCIMRELLPPSKFVELTKKMHTNIIKKKILLQENKIISEEDELKKQIDNKIIEAEVIDEYIIDDNLELEKLNNPQSKNINCEIEKPLEKKKFVSKLMKSSMYDNVSCLGNKK